MSVSMKKLAYLPMPQASIGLTIKRVEGALLNRLAHGRHKMLIKMEIVYRIQLGAEHFTAFIQMV